MHAAAKLSRDWTLTLHCLCKTVRTNSSITANPSLHSLQVCACRGMPVLSCSRGALTAIPKAQDSACTHAPAFPVKREECWGNCLACLCSAKAPVQISESKLVPSQSLSTTEEKHCPRPIIGYWRMVQDR